MAWTHEARYADHPRRGWLKGLTGRKLTVEEEYAICDAFEDGQSAISLARQYGVSRQCIYMVLRRNGVVY